MARKDIISFSDRIDQDETNRYAGSMLTSTEAQILAFIIVYLPSVEHHTLKSGGL